METSSTSEQESSRAPLAQGESPRVLVSIVNYKVSEYTKGAIRSLLESVEDAGFFKVCVIDNDSQDGSFEILRDYVSERGWTETVRVIAAPKNGGFSYGNNLALLSSVEDGFVPDYLYLLNPDTEICPGAIANMLFFMDENPRIGIAGSCVLNEDGTQRPSAWRFHSMLGELERTARTGPISRLLSKATMSLPSLEHAGPVDWVSGAGMMVRREVIEDAGLMDEGFFLYYEETDWCLRALRAGWPTWFNPDSKITHFVGKCTQVTGEGAQERRLPGYMFESRRRYFTKNHGEVYARASDLAWLLGQGVWAARCALSKKGKGEPHIVRDFAAHAFRPLQSLNQQPELSDTALGREKSGRGGPKNAPPLPNGTQNANPPELHLIELLWEDLCTHERRVLEPGFLALVVHRLGNARMDVKSKLLRGPLSVAYKCGAMGIRNGFGIKLDYNVKVGRRVRIWHHGGIILGAREIGNDVHIRQNTTLGVKNRAHPDAKPIIEDGVEIGAGACIVGHTRIGHHSTIGANAVVSHDVPAESLVRGPRGDVVGKKRVATARTATSGAADASPEDFATRKFPVASE